MRGKDLVIKIIITILFFTGFKADIIADNVSGKPTTTQNILLLLDQVDTLSNMNWLRTA